MHPTKIGRCPKMAEVEARMRESGPWKVRVWGMGYGVWDMAYEVRGMGYGVETYLIHPTLGGLLEKEQIFVLNLSPRGCNQRLIVMRLS